MPSYADVIFADTYFETQYGTEEWPLDDDRAKALNSATELMDQLNYIGEKTDPSQEQEFPRCGDSAIPIAIQKACCEIALRLVQGVDIEREIENLDAKSQAFVSVKTTYDRESLSPHLVAGIPSAKAWKLLCPYLRDTSSISIKRVN